MVGHRLENPANGRVCVRLACLHFADRSAFCRLVANQADHLATGALIDGKRTPVRHTRQAQSMVSNGPPLYSLATR